MGTCASKCYPSSSSSPPSTAGSSLRGGSPAPNHHVQEALNVSVPADAAADYASPTPTTTSATTSLLSTTSSISMASSTVSSSSSSSATCCSSPVFVKARPRLQGSELEAASCSWDVVVLDPNKLLSAITSSSNPRAVVRGPPLPMSPGRSKRARPASPRPAPGPGCKKTCNSPKRTGKPPASGRQHQSVGRHRHSRVMLESRKSASCRGAMAAVGVGGGELLDDLNNPLISMDCFIFI